MGANENVCLVYGVQSKPEERLEQRPSEVLMLLWRFFLQCLEQLGEQSFGMRRSLDTAQNLFGRFVMFVEQATHDRECPMDVCDIGERLRVFANLFCERFAINHDFFSICSE